MRLIDADALETHEQIEPLGNGKYEYVEVVYKDDIDNAPTIEPQRWISCSERLPEESGYYLCTCLDGHRSMVTQVKFHPRIKSWNLTGARAYWKVIAWMPLPEPWKGGMKNEIYN